MDTRKLTRITKDWASTHRGEQLGRLTKGAVFQAQLKTDVEKRLMRSRYFVVREITALGYEVSELSLDGQPLQDMFLSRAAIEQLNLSRSTS